MFTQVATILALMATLNGTPVEEHNMYVRTMEVTQLDYTQDIVTCTDAVGVRVGVLRMRGLRRRRPCSMHNGHNEHRGHNP